MSAIRRAIETGGGPHLAGTRLIGFPIPDSQHEH